MTEIALWVLATYFGVGVVVVIVTLIIAIFFGNPGEMHGGSMWWVPINLTIWAAIWPVVTWVLIAGEINSRRVYAKAERELQADRRMEGGAE